MSRNRVYVGGLSHRARERDVEQFFKGYGRLREILLKDGFGFVEFEEYRDAEDAVHDLNGKDLCGQRVRIEFSRPKGSGGGRDGGDRGGRGPPPRYGGGRSPRGGGGGGGDRGARPVWVEKYGPPQQTKYRLIIENLSTAISWQDLKDIFRKSGEVTYADAHRKRKNEGIVCFTNTDDMRRAIEKFDGTEHNGRKIRVLEDRGSRSRSRSRSHSRSRSRSARRSRTKSRSRSRSKSKGSRSRSRSKSHSRSVSPPRDADKKVKGNDEVEQNGNGNAAENHEDAGDD